MRFAVVGHVEWVEFARVEETPRPGEIVEAVERWEEAAGGGAVAAVQIAKLAGECAFFTVFGSDELGRRSREQLEAHGVRVHAVTSDLPQRRAFVHVDDSGERTITVLGTKLRPRRRDDLPWHELRECDAVFFGSGDAESVHAARRARILVATSRDLATLHAAGVELDALVGSGEDEAERYKLGDLEPPPRLVVTTAGALGGWAQPGGPFTAAPVPGAVADAYGCGDAFAAGLTFALGSGYEPPAALEFAARCGAAALTGRGAYAGLMSSV